MADPAVDPLSAENPMVIMTGPFSGTLAPTSSRTCLVSKSPITGTIFESNIGGAFGPELKFAGYDGIVITGKSDKPVYLRIEDDRVTLEDASPVWGKGNFQTEQWLADAMGHGTKSLTIGPAGENGVPFACIGSEAFRQMGRGGGGRLFGAKNLKAVACKGTGGVQVADMAIFWEKVVEHTQTNVLTDDNLWAKASGTPMLVDLTNELGIHPTKNFTGGVNPDARFLDAEAVKAVKIGDRACASCPLGCGKFTSANGTQVEGPEYETLCLAGSNCGISDLETVMRFNRRCDDLGLDTMSTGGTIALAMDLGRSGVHDFGLSFGDADGYLAVLDEIARLSTDRGRDLALGAARLADKYQAPQAAAHAKGLEMPAYDPRGNWGMALAYATSERGACHLRAFTITADEPFKPGAMARAVIDGQNGNAVKWSMCFCDFWGTVDTTIMADLLTAGLGRQVSPKDLDRVGERVWNLVRLFNLKAGFTAENDVLSEKMTRKALENGPHEGRMLSDADPGGHEGPLLQPAGMERAGTPHRRQAATAGD